MEQQNNGALYVMNLHFTFARSIQCPVEEVIIANIIQHMYICTYLYFVYIIYISEPIYHRVVGNIKLKCPNIS